MSQSDPPSTELTRHQYGSYRVLHPLGSGGMSSVYRAVHEDTGHEVALKVLPPGLARNPIALQRFLREARSAERLEHPNVVSIYDRGVDRGRNYIVLEYVEGGDLHGYVQVNGPLVVGEAVHIIRDVADGLGYASRLGLVHRDVKPSNILRSSSGEIKITDLGLALQSDLEDERVTREGTTVGTVDYMAPEQARDSRAASERSDIYSLGCTFYYLLAGIPPFPGGDITDKLTRHARSAPPDIRDLRPDVPVELARLIQRMMAKRPEDRFASFDELIRALDQVALPPPADGPGVSLVPLEGPPEGRPRIPVVALGGAPRPPSSVPEISLANLDLDEDSPLDAGRAGGAGSGSNGLGSFPAAPLPRLPAAEIAGAGPGGHPGGSTSLGGWAALFTAVGLIFILSVVLIDRLVRTGPDDPRFAAELAPEDDGEEETAPALASRPPEPEPEAATVRPMTTVPGPVRKPPVPVPPDPESTWAEPEDPDVRPRREAFSDEILRAYLPDWALVPVPTRLEGPLTVVRRVPAIRDASVVNTLRAGLEKTKGTIEIADEGPFSISTPLLSTENRMVRARPGYRPVIRVEASPAPAARQLPGLVTLESKGLVLDSLDFVVNLRDAGASGVVLFHCRDASLTIRNCTFTLVNPKNIPVTLFHGEGDPARGARIRLEGCLFRGPFATALSMGGGPVDAAIRDTVVIGGQSATVRELEQSPGHRVSIVGAVIGGRGPCVALGEPSPGPTGKPLVVRAYRTVLGRFQGAGIASVIAALKAGVPAQSVSWSGDHNLFAGWKGFFAHGPEAIVLVDGLAGVRSTWNGSDRNSREVLAAWPDLEGSTWAPPSILGPFVPGFEALLDGLPRPRPFLDARTVSAFPEPMIPTPLVVAMESANPAAMDGPGRVLLPSKPRAAPRIAGIPAAAPTGPAATLDGEMLLDCDSPEWHGDLGYFLREKIGPGMKHARVRVTGSGPFRCSAVRLPDGLLLELRVAPPARPEAGWLTWQPDPGQQGKALIELKGGGILLSQAHFQTEPSAPLESLIHVEDGHLILHRCLIAAPPRAEGGSGRLVTFRAATTRPGVGPPSSGLFVREPGRPTCVIADSTLISNAAAVRLELGRGQAAIAGSAIAAATDAIELAPSRVARSRFEADIVLERCTITSESNLLRLEPWPGNPPGPDRPWLVTTRSCAFLGTYDRRVSLTTLLRVDEEAMAGGALFWEARGDALDVDAFTAAGADTPQLLLRDVAFQWVAFWGSNHVAHVTGPRAGTSRPGARLLEKLKPGRVDPAGLILDPTYHPDRPALDFGADLSRQGIRPRPSGTARRY
ncbi:Serine/threonine-protein kinase PrkC [Aquisphaera giovannonii]|uniref:Serine/threonine-protein kinase PrkC n=1 Tax=Aquisphaera giovannonii TaxID=406548 RepID=A0A5B9VYI5_9BACT|nr:serine/threonine-protein kinase [Aquisphaera giovannonii]QEH32795.1 Serine/threonine-protein kinase PrkC [Aquisphaera giovannonii]